MKSIEETGRVPSPSEAVVRRVADFEGVDPTELLPLFDTIDPDALDAIVRSAAGNDDAGLRIEFTYHGYDVTVTGDGVVHVDADVVVEQ